MAAKNVDTHRRAITISNMQQVARQAALLTCLAIRIGTLLAIKIACTLAFTHASILEALQTKRNVGVPFDRPNTLGYTANTS